jgi:hypothetical protein
LSVNPTSFFKPPFSESAVFKTTPSATGQTITVLAKRGEQGQSTLKRSDISSVSHPFVITIQKSEVATVTPKVNTITIKNIKYTDETFVIKEIIYADEYIWRVAI